MEIHLKKTNHTSEATQASARAPLPASARAGMANGTRSTNLDQSVEGPLEAENENLA